MAAGKSKERFSTENVNRLNAEDIKFSIRTTQTRPSTSFQDASPAESPRKDFEDSSFKTKKRRVEDLIHSRSGGELMTAAEVAVRSNGQRNVANVIRDISESPENMNSLECSKPVESRQLTCNEALAYYIESKSTTHSYKQTRKWSMKARHNAFPSYYSLFT